MIQGAQKKRKNSGSQSLFPHILKTKQKGSVCVCVCDSHLQSHWWMKTDGNKNGGVSSCENVCRHSIKLDSFYCLTLRWNDVQIDGQQQERQCDGCRGHHHLLLLHNNQTTWLLRNVVLLDLSLSSLWCINTNLKKKRKKEKKRHAWMKRERQSDNWILLMCAAYTIWKRQVTHKYNTQECVCVYLFWKWKKRENYQIAM